MAIRRRIGALLIAALLGLWVTVALATPAYAGDYPHRLTHADSGLCLEVPGGSMQFGTQLQLGVCGPSPTWYQIFVFTDQGSPHLYFVRPGHNWWCIQPGVGALNRSTIVQVGCDWNSYQLWSLYPISPGSVYYTLQNAGSGYCLIVDEAFIGAYARQSDNCGQGIGGGQAYWRLA